MKRFISLFLILLLVLSLSACGGEGYTIYFKNADGNRLLSEERKIKEAEGASEEELVSILIKQLTKIPKTEGGLNALPEGTKLLSVNISGSIAIVDVSGQYYMNKDVDELLSRMAIVNTLCGIDGVDSVRIKVDGKPLVSSTTGTEIGVIRMSDIASSAQDTNVAVKETVTIYFPDKDGEKLVAVRREVEPQSSLSLERLIISELSKGPGNGSDLVQVIPSDIKVLSTETKDGVCFVNLSGDFVDRIPGGSSSTTMALYSIVNSLTELSGVNSVQILIDGKTGVEFGNYVLDAAIERNNNLIKE